MISITLSIAGIVAGILTVFLAMRAHQRARRPRIAGGGLQQEVVLPADPNLRATVFFGTITVVLMIAQLVVAIRK
jgi:hypothetical protein